MAVQLQTVAFRGIDVIDIEVQVQISNGLPAFNIVGLADKAVAESKERIRAALHAMGLSLPAKRLTVNLAPADVAKEGAHYDLPIALGLLQAMNIIPSDCLENYIVLGELALDGRISTINGALPAAIHAQSQKSHIICPKSCGAEAAWAGDCDVYAPDSLLQLIQHLKGQALLQTTKPNYSAPQTQQVLVDIADIKGQETAKRALEIAAAGGHNLLMIGPPGAGKSMLAERLPTILPPLSPMEALDVSMIHSLSGNLPEEGLMRERPYRDPHHSASLPALIGGGQKIKPGEISLAHRGVLFLDEFPEFPRAVLEALRQPLESGKTLVARVNHHVTYPAKFQLIAAMNPCRCGYLGDASMECNKAPRCGGDYQAKLSGPILDRIDIHIDLPALSVSELSNTPQGENSKTILSRVEAARLIQAQRIKAHNLNEQTAYTNAEIPAAKVDEIIIIEPQAKALLTQSADKFKLSARAYHRVLRVAQTIADLSGQNFDKPLEKQHIAEALSYRRLSLQ